ncbi:MAG: START-like domain-containing protein [Porphyromonas sp.]|nr:START-like domain-containing protein [Porphyromonas sp.]
MKMRETSYREEFLLDHVSIKSLWNQISTANGLADWFAYNVEKEANQFTFFWDKRSMSVAFLVDSDPERFISFQWEEPASDGVEVSFLSFEIVKAEISGAVSLLVRDDELSTGDPSANAIWSKHISQLKKSLGLT